MGSDADNLKPKPAYKSDVVYGAIDRWEFDTLSDVYEGQGTLNNRHTK